MIFILIKYKISAKKQKEKDLSQLLLKFYLLNGFFEIKLKLKINSGYYLELSRFSSNFEKIYLNTIK